MAGESGQHTGVLVSRMLEDGEILLFLQIYLLLIIVAVNTQHPQTLSGNFTFP